MRRRTGPDLDVATFRGQSAGQTVCSRERSGSELLAGAEKLQLPERETVLQTGPQPFPAPQAVTRRNATCLVASSTSTRSPH
jgi:hypothetical protein